MLTDTIAALATGPGRSAVALIRVSGRDALRVAQRVLRPFAPEPARVARRGRARGLSDATGAGGVGRGATGEGTPRGGGRGDRHGGGRAAARFGRRVAGRPRRPGAHLRCGPRGGR